MWLCCGVGTGREADVEGVVGHGAKFTGVSLDGELGCWLIRKGDVSIFPCLLSLNSSWVIVYCRCVESTVDSSTVFFTYQQHRTYVQNNVVKAVPLSWLRSMLTCAIIIILVNPQEVIGLDTSARWA